MYPSSQPADQSVLGGPAQPGDPCPSDSVAEGAGPESPDHPGKSPLRQLHDMTGGNQSGSHVKSVTVLHTWHLDSTVCQLSLNAAQRSNSKSYESRLRDE